MSLTQKIIFLFLLLLTVFSQTMTMFRSGLTYPYGIGFWGPTGHDGIWHLALSQQIKNPLKIQHPSLSGQTLQNYHPFYNILVAASHRLTGIKHLHLIFQVFPLLFSLTLSFLSFKLGKLITQKNSTGLYLMFLTTFSGSLGWLISFLKNQDFYGESIFWSMQSLSTQINPPYALSLIFGLIILLSLIQKKYLLLTVCLALLPITKIYGAVIFYFFTFYHYLQKPNQKLFKAILISSCLGLILFLIYNSFSASILQFQPLWFVHSLIDSSDRLYLPKISSLRSNIRFFDPRFLLIELISFSLFVIGNFSFRLLGPIDKTKFPLKKSTLGSIALSLIIPTLFVQKGTAWNTIQFLYYGLFLSNILLAVFLSNQKTYRLPLVVIILTLISNIGTLKTYLGSPAPAALPPNEIKALDFIRQQTPGIILTQPYNPYLKSGLSAPIPLYAYETTAYVSAFTGFPTYLSDQMNLTISGYNFSPQLENSTDFFAQAESQKFKNRGLLLNNNIDYIYLVKHPNLIPLNTQQMDILPIFENENTIVYKVNK